MHFENIANGNSFNFSDLFRACLPVTPKCLELFARYLMPNCTSIGFDVLKMQNLDLFVEHHHATDDPIPLENKNVK